ncbi:hypothetical protein TRFO_02716 [Tritrichomonas foetus]|uniref:Uncharacterized protein n=1 Tax=Tritrichomonas foetus TaxID=1144522 RepID=A0A1J4L3A2_9EUKA|nr:hypothetical protein TRFO_02716 [Tritrichomonas foetus]|eukprot:OHT16452.1 hypothetical protein TRFO_02716 [Tritrichomonas foetus]
MSLAKFRRCEATVYIFILNSEQIISEISTLSYKQSPTKIMSSKRPVVHIYPRGTYKAPAFYFRGAEPLTEPEYLVKQLSVSREVHKNSRRELEKAKAEFSQLSQSLSQKDGYTVALASALGEESYSTEENARLRHELADLTTRIEAVERSIKYYKEQQGTALVAGLVREKAYYHAEIENLRLEIFEGIDNIRNGKAKLGNIVSSEKYAHILHTIAEHSAVQHLYHKLRSDMNHLFKTFNDKTPPKNSKHARKPENTEIRNLYEQKQNAAIELNEVRNEKYYTENLAKYTSLAMIDQIEAMNQVLVSLGGEELDVNELRAEFLNSNDSGKNSPSSTRKNHSSSPDSPKNKVRTRTKGGLPTSRRSKTSYGMRP